MNVRSDHRVRWCIAAACAVLGGLLGVVMLVVPVSGAAMPSAGPAAGDLWPTFGHDPIHSGVSSDTAITALTAAGLRKQWSASLTSTLNQPSPAVAYSAKLSKTVVYAVTYSGVLSAFNAATGTLLWQRSLGSTVDSSPAVKDGTVYVGDLNGTIHALNADTGTVECTFTLPLNGPSTKPGRLISSPVVGNVDGTGPTVFLGDAGTAGTNESLNGGHFWAITGVGNTAGGCRERWVYNKWPNKGPHGTQTGVWDEPALAQNSNGTWEVVFGSSNPDDSVYALDAVNGSRLWRFQTLNRGPDEDVGAGPTIDRPGSDGFADGAVFVDGKDGIEYALNLLTGKRIWSFTLGAGTADTNGVSEGVLSGNKLVVCYGASVFALNARTGAKIWKTTAGARIEASPVVSGPRGHQVLFVGELNGTERGLKLQNGSQLFAAATSGKLQASAAVAVGRLYFVSGGSLYAYAPRGS